MALAGSQPAYQEIVRRYERPVFNLIARIVRDSTLAEDVAQVAFVKAFRGLAKWRREAAFSTWLFALAANLYRTEIRRIPPRTVGLDEIAEPVDPRGTEPDLEDREQRRLVQRALKTLPPKYRDALVLFYFHGMDIVTAAQSLRLPEGTMKARLSRGRDMLRRKLLHATR